MRKDHSRLIQFLCILALLAALAVLFLGTGWGCSLARDVAKAEVPVASLADVEEMRADIRRLREESGRAEALDAKIADLETRLADAPELSSELRPFLDALREERVATTTAIAELEDKIDRAAPPLSTTELILLLLGTGVAGAGGSTLVGRSIIKRAVNGAPIERSG